MPDKDIKVGENVISRRLILSPSDPVFDPRFRPPLDTAIPWILAYRGPWLIPYASVPFDHHRGVGEQNLFRCLFGRDSLIIADFLGARVPGLRRGVFAALGEAQRKNSIAKVRKNLVGYRTKCVLQEMSGLAKSWKQKVALSHITDRSTALPSG